MICGYDPPVMCVPVWHFFEVAYVALLVGFILDALKSVFF